MSAHVIGHITVKDFDKWAQYRASVPATLVPWGGEVVMRGRCVEVLCGEHAHTDVVVIRFPDAAAADGWYRSPAYQALIPLRVQAADMLLIHCDA